MLADRAGQSSRENAQISFSRENARGHRGHPAPMTAVLPGYFFAMRADWWAIITHLPLVF